MASQHSDSELFERIVQEVIRRLVAGGVTVGATGNKQLALSERVITLATLDGKLDGVENPHNLPVSQSQNLTVSQFHSLIVSQFHILRVSES